MAIHEFMPVGDGLPPNGAETDGAREPDEDAFDWLALFARSVAEALSHPDLEPSDAGEGLGGPRTTSGFAQASPAVANFDGSPSEMAGIATVLASPLWWPGLRGLLPRVPEADVPATPAPSAASAPTAAGALSYTGAGQAVVVIDTGYSTVYDQSNTVYSYDFSGRNDADASTRGADSHGSWVAETVVDQASGVEIIHLKVFDDAGQTARLADIEQALDWAIELTDSYAIAAVNLSLGFGNTTEESWTRLSDEFAELDELGVFTIVAAGNDGELYDDGVNVLAADPNVIAVSAVDETGAFADFSQTDAELTDISALGTDVSIDTATGSQLTVSGTSFAAPEVAGIAAVLQEASLDINGETLSDDEFLEILQSSGTSVAGYEDADIAGYAVADADAALQYFIDNADTYDDPLIG